MTRILCAGHANWDVTLRVDRLPQPDDEARIVSQHQSGGGSAANAAAVLAQLHADATLLGSVGPDEHGRDIRAELTALGVETRFLETVGTETTVKYLVVDRTGEVFMLGNEGANEAFVVDTAVSEEFEQIDHLHLTSQRPETALELAQQAAERDVSVSFDPGRRVADREYEPVLERADLLFVTEREFESIETDRPGQTMVVKRGAKGAQLREGDRTVSHPGFEVDVVDTAGAGDAFAGGFLAARGTRPAEEALAVANACGALAVQSLGARTHLSWDGIDALLADMDR
ncbi:carbohydrate kinase family protein [Halapricum hydrolyticum]|uniref:PfkB family carbohydrate kinase n=1 Tax=Halapricum hydrolyticum TaxID=2979991 RepID=A0AAE3ID80_9EURY|nr:PfkB family carbohydrate kinase [Halapricum hydrolyticum]MCU4719449.1 PfkB family carbohydrate kinase [Halapricum hydrolyticum]MCU4728458.1 PfkB family carbohydrate kinase [Halapricum hydrolyticum]